MDFPRLVYMHNAATHMAVNNAVEHREALKAGWFDSVPEAIAGKSSAPVAPPAPVVVFKKTGAKVEKQAVADQATADALIAGDGWHATEAAAIAATWPAPDAIPGIIEDLSKKPADAIVEYAAGIGLKPHKNEKPAALLARVETTLLGGAPAAQ
jgi:hypothetical protein